MPLPRHVADLKHPAAAAKAIKKLRPEIVINCVAWSAVDDAESRSVECYDVNAIVVDQIAKACNKIYATLVQLSTDYVFGADRNRTVPFSETDAPSPVNVYVASKLAGEVAAATAVHHLIIRTAGLYSASESEVLRGRNFADTMLSIAEDHDTVRVINDQQRTRSLVPHIAREILDLLLRGARGLYHVANSSSTIWHASASELFSFLKSKLPSRRLQQMIIIGSSKAPIQRAFYGQVCLSEWRFFA